MMMISCLKGFIIYSSLRNSDMGDYMTCYPHLESLEIFISPLGELYRPKLCTLFPIKATELFT